MAYREAFQYVRSRQFDLMRCPTKLRDRTLYPILTLLEGSSTTMFYSYQEDHAVGLVTLHDIKEIPRSSWSTTTAAQAMIRVEKLGNNDPGAEPWTAMEKMGREGTNQMPVMQGDNLVGMLSMGDTVKYLHTLQQVGA